MKSIGGSSVAWLRSPRFRGRVWHDRRRRRRPRRRPALMRRTNSSASLLPLVRHRPGLLLGFAWASPSPAVPPEAIRSSAAPASEEEGRRRRCERVRLAAAPDGSQRGVHGFVDCSRLSQSAKKVACMSNTRALEHSISNTRSGVARAQHLQY